MPSILAALAGISAMLLAIGIFRPNRSTAARRRLAELELQVADDPHAESFARRVLAPVVARVAVFAGRMLPSGVMTDLAAKLEAAGMQVSAERFAVLWVGFAALAPTLCGLFLVSRGADLSSRLLGAMALWVLMGLIGPWLYVRGRATERVAVIDRSLPDVVDLIVTNIESGLGLQAAMLNVAGRFPGVIADEFSRVIRETSLGRPREEAIEAMATRIGSKDLKLFSRAVMQAERTGIPVGKVLRSQAIEIRRRRRQLAREKAGKMPVKMTILTVAFMFPTLFMLLLGPVVLNMMETLKR
jgi:tight adherence protein C